MAVHDEEPPVKPWGWDWGELVHAGFERGSLTFDVGPLVWLCVPLAGLVWVWWNKPWRTWLKRWKPVKFRLALIGVECEITPNDETAQIAHQAYVELVTRKAALPFDDQHDSVSEIYDSWYALFGELRKLARAISARDVRDEEALCTLLDLLTDVLNKGLRPHLTRWQGRYRAWLKAQRDEGSKLPESALQRSFPDYEELVASLKETNAMLAELSVKLGQLAHGKDSQ